MESFLLQGLFERMASHELLYFARQEGIGKELDQLRKTLSIIRAVLDDTEEKQPTERPVKKWLDDLIDLAYDLDDMLDEFITEALQRRLKGGDLASTYKVRNLISACYNRSTASDFKINSRLRLTEVTDRFNDLITGKYQLKLKECADGRLHRIRSAMTDAHVYGSEKYTVMTDAHVYGWEQDTVMTDAHVSGREKDKEAVLELLLGEKFGDPAEISVIPILGIGGIGKTTLAQLVYKDEKVKNFFDLRAWVCVSEEFDAVRVAKTILESVILEHFDENDLNLLHVKLRENLKGKRFLVILDDVWNENYHDWMTLRAPLKAGAPGSAIVITTRKPVVSSKMGTVPAYILKQLSNDDCSSLFTKHALGASNFSSYPNLKDIGEKIVEKCKGLPLAAKTLGGLLRTSLNRDQWEVVLKSKIWDIPEGRSGIVPALMLSYYYLPSHLKRCIAYCSILPKDYEFTEKQLVLLWMAEGVVHPQEDGKQVEDLGSKFFRDLLTRSFFQRASGHRLRFVMHDLVNDLSQSVAGDTCFRLGDGFGRRISRRARHLSYMGSKSDGQMFEGISKLTYLRTLLRFMRPEQGGCQFNCKFPLQLLPKFRSLRALSLGGYNIIDLPESIGDLRHLRYLDLSNTSIPRLPKSITTLYNLQALILENCSKLEKLPTMFRNLVNLRHLDIRKTCWLKEMPPQMGKLTCLQTLSDFIVGKSPCSGVKELGPLLHLGGTLHISRLENVIQPRDATYANLIQKVNLGGLLLEWSCNVDDPQDKTSELDVLNMLQPPKALKDLTIKSFGGTEFPTWLRPPSFPSMVLLRLENCKRCTSLPPVGQLSSLKDLSIIGMDRVEKVGPEFYEGGVSQPFASLETLCFENMAKWENWIPCGEFPHLRELSIQSCPKLSGKLPGHLPLLKRVKINGCPLLQEIPTRRVVHDSPQGTKLAKHNKMERNLVSQPGT